MLTRVKIRKVSLLNDLKNCLIFTLTLITPEYRSEKLQNRLQNRLDVLNFGLYETFANQVQQEMMQELRNRVKALKGKKDCEDYTAEELCDLLDFDDESDSPLKVSPKMHEKIDSVRQERRYDMNRRIQERLGEQSKNIKQLIKFRVVDCSKLKKTALVSCWKIDEDLLDLLKEGQVIEITNATTGAFVNEIQITAGNSCSIRRISADKTSPVELKTFFREEMKISEIDSNFQPPNDEFDAAFVVTHVDTKNSSGFVKVYVADENFNFLCLNFWSSLSENAFDDVVIEGQLIYAQNLQWRFSQAKEKIPQAFVKCETTLLMLHPKKEIQKSRLKELQANIENLEEFLIKSKEKLSIICPLDKLNKENQDESTVLKDILAPPQTPFLSKSLGTRFSPNPCQSIRKRLGNLSYSFQNSSKKPKVTKLSALQKIAFK